MDYQLLFCASFFHGLLVHHTIKVREHVTKGLSSDPNCKAPLSLFPTLRQIFLCEATPDDLHRGVRLYIVTHMHGTECGPEAINIIGASLSVPCQVRGIETPVLPTFWKASWLVQS